VIRAPLPTRREVGPRISAPKPAATQRTTFWAVILSEVEGPQSPFRPAQHRTLLGLDHLAFRQSASSDHQVRPPASESFTHRRAFDFPFSLL